MNWGYNSDIDHLPTKPWVSSPGLENNNDIYALKRGRVET
jgi:hypothetical protein